MDFWSPEALDLEDPLNQEIWDTSPGIQDEIQAYSPDWKNEDVGAQQAMRYPHRLPWVPDPVGKDWRRRDAILAFGSAYAPFISGNGQRREIDPLQYADSTCQEFMGLLQENLLTARSYYREITKIFSPFMQSCRLLGLVDLCRAAFVRRLPNKDQGGDGVVRAEGELFSRYVESPTASEWLWRRIEDSESSMVVALGTIAEHGLLRLFKRRLARSRIVDSNDPTIFFSLRANSDWCRSYASRRRTLNDRCSGSNVAVWVVTGLSAQGIERTWRLAVVPHPGERPRSTPFPTYEAIRTALG